MVVQKTCICNNKQVSRILVMARLACSLATICIQARGEFIKAIVCMHRRLIFQRSSSIWYMSRRFYMAQVVQRGQGNDDRSDYL